MIVVMKPQASEQSIHAITKYIKDNGLQVHLSQGEEVTIIGTVAPNTAPSIDLPST